MTQVKCQHCLKNFKSLKSYFKHLKEIEDKELDDYQYSLLNTDHDDRERNGGKH